MKLLWNLAYRYFHKSYICYIPGMLNFTKNIKSIDFLSMGPRGENFQNTTPTVILFQPNVL